MKDFNTPPQLFLRLFRSFCKPALRTHIEGDLIEVYNERLRRLGKRRADFRFAIDVLLLCRPGIIGGSSSESTNNYAMFKSYFRIGWRNLVRDKGYSMINIGGLALGLTVTMLIGLWIYDEISYDNYHTNRERVAGVFQHLTIDGSVETMGNQSYQLGDELRNNYGANFERVAMGYFTSSILSYQKKAFNFQGGFAEDGIAQLFSLRIKHGTADLKDPSSILISESASAKLFAGEHAIGKSIRLDNRTDLKVTGVYEDAPSNSSLHETDFFVPLDLMIARGGRSFGWVNNWLLVFVQLADNVDMLQASEAIKDVKLKNVDEYEKRYAPVLFLHPMSKWRLHDNFVNGVNTGGRIDFIWLFGAIGAFVLVLGCINFMNLSTARYQRRAKEVGIRKVVGSARMQLVSQFYAESFLVVLVATLLALVLAQLAMPWFNMIAEKNIGLPLAMPSFWLALSAFIVVTVIISGSYPALYLSSFSPSKVLKGTFKAGRLAATPRKALVILQFAVSVTLAIGTTIVYQQVQHARSRPIGYDLNGLITIPIKTPGVKQSYQGLRNEMIANGVALEVSTSETTVTDLWWSDGGMGWRGKAPDVQDYIYRGAVDYEFGKTVGWKIVEGRDFSRDFKSDTAAMILNQAAVAYMGFSDPVGEIIDRYGRKYTVIGVVQDMINQSLYKPVRPTYFMIDQFDQATFINVRVNPHLSASEALIALERIFIKHNPDTPFEYDFADEDFSDKYAFEQHVGTLVGVFACLAILISCLGLFGLASFVAEQRIKEIGIRKVLGASTFSVWRLLSRDFMLLVAIAVAVSIPVAWFLMNGWLQAYDYRTEISWMVFASCGLGALLITIVTVSYQSIKAGVANPVDSLRSE